ncbi:hypothetical protein HK100_000532 [Physocladia obscura]|uniref:K Homology domain-containing protein n=1 Tax=Physocladia obscura TaxID=109957 RepID=A0AAD5T115_9FUNG|nr:hypothetical protein HK100_000532 [Physocladia obscura]
MGDHPAQTTTAPPPPASTATAVASAFTTADVDRSYKRPHDENSDDFDADYSADTSTAAIVSTATDDEAHKAKRQAVASPDRIVVSVAKVDAELYQTVANEQITTSAPITMRAIISMKEAGMIIGKNGKNVADIRENAFLKKASGARVTVSDNIPGAVERVVTIAGPLDTVAKAFALCATKIVEEAPNTIEDVKQRPLQMRILVPNQRMGSIIGKQGAKIKEIQDASGSKLSACEEILPHSTERIVIVSGVIDSIHIATYHIGAVLQEHHVSFLRNIKYNSHFCFRFQERSAGTIMYKPLPGLVTGQITRSNVQGASMASSASNQRHQQQQLVQQGMYGQMATPYYGVPQMTQAYGGYNMANAAGTMTPMMPQGALTVQQIFIPNEMVGAIIGKGGVKINEIRSQSGCNIKIADAVPGATERLITVTGSPEANSMALYMLYQRLEMEKQKGR